MSFITKIKKTDVLIILFILYLSIFCDINYIDVTGYNPIVVGVSIYFTTKIVQLLLPFLFDKIFLTILFVVLLREIILGYSQLMNSTGILPFCLTGSFIQSGLYGGFLTILVCVFSGFIFKENSAFYKTVIGSGGLTQKKKAILFTQYILLLLGFAIIFLIICTQSRTSILSLVISLSVLAFKNSKAKLFINKHWLKITCLIVVFGFGAYFYKKPSADGRFLMNRISIRAIASNKWNGVGPGNYAGAYGKSQAALFSEMMSSKNNDIDWEAIGENKRLIADCPTKAFNEYLNIGVEYGVISLMLFSGIIVTAIIQSLKNDNAWCFGLIGFSIFALFSYPLHSLQFQILLPFLLGACTRGCDSRSDVRHIVFYLAFICIQMFNKNNKNTPNYDSLNMEWSRASYWYNAKEYQYVIETCDNLLLYFLNDYEFLFAYGHSLNKVGQYEKSDSILKIGTELSSDPMFWNVMGNNSLAQGRYREAEERYKYAFYMVPNRLYPLYLLAKLYYTEGDTVRFLQMAEMVEEFIPKVESVNTESLRTEIRELKSTLIMTNNCDQ